MTRELFKSADPETQKRWRRLPAVQAALGKTPARPGRRGHSDLFYAQVASAYVDLFRGGSRHPVRDLAAKLRLSEPRVRDLVWRARRRGMLTPSPIGRAGGDLTSKAVAILNASPKGQPSTKSTSHRSRGKRGKGKRSSKR